MDRFAFIRAALPAIFVVSLSFACGCGGQAPDDDTLHGDGVPADSVDDHGFGDVVPDHLAELATDVPGEVNPPDADVSDVADPDSGELPDHDVHADVDVVSDAVEHDVPGRDAEWDDVPDPPPSFPVVRGGVSSHVIVVADDASLSERTAAAEIQLIIVQASGVELPISSVPPDGDIPMIVVGCGLAAQGLGVMDGPESFEEGEYLIRVVGNSVVIAGNPAAGTMHGAHDFLKTAVGVRWTAPGVTVVPQAAEVVFPVQYDRRYKSPFFWRTTTYEWPGADRAFWAHQAENSGSSGADAAFGVEHWHDGIAHSYFSFVSPDEFWDTHPEFFSEIGGVRVREETQLCLTNPDLLDIVTERMLARMAAHPDAMQHNFSQMDHYNQCQCDKCRAMNQLYQSEGGTQFWFVNELAKRTAVQYPDKQIGTLAYMYTEEPPVGLELHPNVAVWLCHMYPSCDSHPIRTCPDNADYKRRAQAWAELTDHLYVWHYIVDFMHYYNPFPNFWALADNIRFYRDIGVEGIFLQGMGHQGGGGEFSLLRPWFGMQLLWDPDQDVGLLIKRFLKDYYGPAWGPIWDWIVLLQARVDDEDIHMHLYSNPAQGYLPEEIVVTGERLFAEAAALVEGNAILEDRVDVARMPLLYARFFPRNGYTISDGWLRWNPGMATWDDVNLFLQMMNDHGFTSYREAQGSPDTMTMLYMMIGADAEVKTITNGRLSVDVVPTLAGRALRITDVASGQTVTAWDQRRNLFYPFQGGLEDRVGEGFNFMGWVEPGSASAVTASGLKVTLNTMNGFKLVRQYQLDPVEPVLTVTSTLTNPGTGTVSARLRPHLEMDMGTLEQTRVDFVARDGGVVSRGMDGVIAGMRQGEHFYDMKAPAGEWSFTGTKGLRLTYGFDDELVDYAWLYAYPARDGELEMEVFAKAVTLGPGESFTFTARIEVQPIGSN